MILPDLLLVGFRKSGLGSGW